MTIDCIFDGLMRLQGAKPKGNWRALAASWTIRLAGDLATGIAVGLGIVLGLALAG
ncbi:hypothetical protein [Mesorhizobium sp. 43Arga]